MKQAAKRPDKRTLEQRRRAWESLQREARQLLREHGKPKETVAQTLHRDRYGRNSEPE